MHKLWTEPEAHLPQSLRKFSFLDRTRLISIVSFEGIQPLVYIVEQFLELNDIDCARAISVEHRNHQRASLIGKVLSFAIYKRCLKFLRINFAATVLVNLIEEILRFRTDSGLLTWITACIAWIVPLKIIIEEID